MNTDEKVSVKKAREYTVAKSNQIVQKTRYDFTVNEQKTIAYLCSMIKPINMISKAIGTPFLLDYEFNILDYSRICGVANTGKMYEACKTILKGLRDKSMWLTLEDGSETAVGWIDRVVINKGDGVVKVKLDDRLVPYLFNLQEKYLSYGLKNVLRMKSQYSIRLYELLKSYYDMKMVQFDNRIEEGKKYFPRPISWTIDLDKLKCMLMVDTIKSYNDYGKLRQKVLEIAQKEINEMTDINICITPVTKGRKTIKITFRITRKDRIENAITDRINDEKLG